MSMSTKEQRARKRAKRKAAQRKQAITFALVGIGFVVMSVYLVMIGRQKAEPLASAEVIAQGEQLFAQNCAACHGASAEGYGIPQAPALDDTEHVMHHSDGALQRTILQGGMIMPAFGETLSPDDAASVIRYLQTLWSPSVLSNQQLITRNQQDPFGE